MGILTSLGPWGKMLCVCVILKLKHWRHETVAHLANVIKHKYELDE